MEKTSQKILVLGDYGKTSLIYFLEEILKSYALDFEIIKDDGLSPAESYGEADFLFINNHLGFNNTARLKDILAHFSGASLHFYQDDQMDPILDTSKAKRNALNYESSFKIKVPPAFLFQRDNIYLAVKGLSDILEKKAEEVFSKLAQSKALSGRAELISQGQAPLLINNYFAQDMDASLLVLEKLQGKGILILGGATEAQSLPLNCFEILKEKIRLIFIVGKNRFYWRSLFPESFQSYCVKNLDDLFDALQLEYKPSDDFILFSPSAKPGISYERMNERFESELKALCSGE